MYNFVSEFYDHIVPYRDRDDVGFYVDEAASAGGGGHLILDLFNPSLQALAEYPGELIVVAQKEE